MAARPRSAPLFAIERGSIARDRRELIDLMARNLACPRETSESRFARYFDRNPAGPPVVVVARTTSAGEIVGMFATHRVPIRMDGQRVAAGIQGDLAVDLEHRGPFGPAVQLVRAMNAELDASELGLVFGNPNDNSRRLVLALSCEPVGSIDLWAKPLRINLLLDQLLDLPRPLHAATGSLDRLARVLSRDDRHLGRGAAYTLEAPDRFDDRFGTFSAQAARGSLIGIERAPAFLNWKFGFDRGEVGSPYILLALVDSADAVCGYAVVEDVPRGLSIVDIVCSPVRAVAESLVGRLVDWARRRGSASIGLRYCGPPEPLPSVLRSFGFLRRKRKEMLVVRFADDLLSAGVRERDSWYYIGGDGDI